MTLTTSTFPKPRVLASVVGLCGIAMVYLGFLLLNAGGSAYFLISGIALLTCSALLFLGNANASPLYGIFLALTLLWSFYEVGLDAWALMPRLGLFSAIGIWFLLPRVRRGLLQAYPEPLYKKREFRFSSAFISILLLTIYISNTSTTVQSPSSPGTGLVTNQTGQWQDYGATKRGTRFLDSEQINLNNINQLERAWEVRTGVPGAFKGTPIQVDDGLYLCSRAY